MSGNRGTLFRSLETMFSNLGDLFACREALFGNLKTLWRCLEALFFCLDGAFATTCAISTAKRPKPPKPPLHRHSGGFSRPCRRSGVSAERRTFCDPQLRRSAETPLRLR
jgi:hypothetical protein